MVPVVTLVALYLTFQGSQAIVNLLLLGYAFVTQLFPSMTMSLLSRNPVNKWGAGAGMVAGAVIVAWLTLGKCTVGAVLPFLPASLHHLNVGVLAARQHLRHRDRLVGDALPRRERGRHGDTVTCGGDSMTGPCGW